MLTYCCFWCPTKDYSGRSLDDACPMCGRSYRYPLSNAPTTIGPHTIVRPLGRGFYGATYVAERGALKTKSVLKVSPKSFFDFFPDKDFIEECQTHARVAEETEHIVDIRHMFGEEVHFGDERLPCWIAELQYIDGELLAHYLHPGSPVSAQTAAQIAIDLLRIHEELKKKHVHHNDLHAENVIVQKLRTDASRADALDDAIRAVAIDLGSVSGRSKSDGDTSRLGDLHRIAEHLTGLIGNLLRDPDYISDRDNRIARALQLIVQTITPRVENQRTPNASDLIRDIEDAYYRATHHWRPWREPLVLKTFSASYNAQTMHPWHVPQLLVDPAGQWLNKITAPGPQVITGMRGCGKTMLLRALQFHARAVPRSGESDVDALKRLKADGYVGLFVSAQRLLNRPGHGAPEEKAEPFERLFATYGLEACRAISHLQDIDRESVSPLAYRDLAAALGRCVDGLDDVVAATSMEDLDRRLEGHLILLAAAHHDYVLRVGPEIAFPRLAKALQDCSTVWRGARVLFLLDDVSTRYLNQSRIEVLVSALLFQDATCAFKLTSERQTLALGLKSPGQNHPVRIGRDLAVFDLGAEVYEKIKRPGPENGRHFVERILTQRVEHFASHPLVSPSALLGDAELETLAGEIGESGRSSRGRAEGKRKAIYRGITALARMCVGDIGDVISLYEQILKTAGKNFPVSARVQSECFQDFCARRLYDLNRRKPYLMDVAKSFAEASHELLVDSCRQKPRGKNPKRIRQYLSLYVRITTGNFERQSDQLRELIDAGVFVFAGGSHVPRAKTRDSNPMQQFKLTYRKIYGLVNFIGLAERDRFELSGADLEDWLSEPKRGKEILLRNHVRCDPDVGIEPDESEDLAQSLTNETERGGSRVHGPEPRQRMLVPNGTAGAPVLDDSQVEVFVQSQKPVVKYLGSSIPAATEIDCVVVGLGFEDRTLESVRRLCASVEARAAIAVRYREKGKRKEIVNVLERSCEDVSVHEYARVIATGFPPAGANVAVDITGLAKPVIFHSIRNQLRKQRRVWIYYTEAESYYPLDSELERVLKSERTGDRRILFEALSGILTGEEAPYEVHKLLASDSDDTRQRALCAFSSPKHERLLTLLDSRDYDLIEIVAPARNTPRNQVAFSAAEIAARNFPNSNITTINPRSLDETLAFIVRGYKNWYVDGNLNLEFGLTGSKIQAVACAAASATLKISQCWYLQPKRFDASRFTRGVAETHVYEISV